MTERPQLSVVDGGKGGRESDDNPTPVSTSLEARLMAELRAQREHNAELTLDAGASRAAVALAARRQEDLLVQLQVERDARRQAEVLLRERGAALRRLVDQLGLAGKAIEGEQANSLALAAEAQTANAQSAELQERLTHIEARLRETVVRLSEFKAHVRERDTQLIAARAELNDLAAQNHDLRERLTAVLAKNQAAAALARTATAENAEMAAQVRAFVDGLSGMLGDTALAKDFAAAGFRAVLDRVGQLQAAYLEGRSTVAELVAEKAAISIELADVAAKHSEMSGKAENRYYRLNRMAAELAALRDTVARGNQVAGGLQASLKERDATLGVLKKEHARAQAELAILATRASQLEQQKARAEADLAAATALGNKQKAELRAEMARIDEASRMLAQRAEAAEIDNTRLKQVEEALRAELSDLNTLLEERRTIIRQLQQERALVKLGRKRPAREP